MIETTRLLIRPLTHTQLLQYIRCDHSLEAELGIGPAPRTMSPELAEALEQTIVPQVANPQNNYLYHTLWTAIGKAENTMVGDLCLIAEPGQYQQVEIGYGTYDAFQGRGYMTELVGGMLQWLRHEGMVHTVIASTDKSNIASYRVLQKNGFRLAGETDTSFNWKLEW